MASIPFEFECNMEAGFVMDPNQHWRLGYVTSLFGFGLEAPLATDLQVSVAFNTGAKPAFTGLQYKSGSPVGSAKVVGVIEKFSWDGSVGGMISLDFCVSQQNAVAIKSLQQLTLKTTTIKSFAWWIVDYDQQVKMWFEQAYPMGGSVTGLVAGQDGNLMLNVDMLPVPAKAGIPVYKVSLAVEPGANRAYELQFADSSKIKVVKPWGLVVGMLAKEALPPQP
jgi:hypothetical protein